MGCDLIAGENICWFGVTARDAVTLFKFGRPGFASIPNNQTIKKVLTVKVRTFFMGRPGFEPGTVRLRGVCSTS